MERKHFDFEQGTKDRYIEGFLGENKESKILFLLREPHVESDEGQQDFWFKRILDDKDDDENHIPFRKPKNLKYFNTYATLASYLLDIPDTEEELKAIRQCAYLNLFARSGTGSASPKYIETRDYLVNLLKGNPIPEDELQTEAGYRAHRFYGLLHDLLNNGTQFIVTVGDIYTELKYFAVDQEWTWLDLTYKKKPKGQQEKVERTKSFNGVTVRLFEKEVKLLWFWHPSYPTYQPKLLQKTIDGQYIINVLPRAYKKHE